MSPVCDVAVAVGGGVALPFNRVCHRRLSKTASNIQLVRYRSLLHAGCAARIFSFCLVSTSTLQSVRTLTAHEVRDREQRLRTDHQARPLFCARIDDQSVPNRSKTAKVFCGCPVVGIMWGAIMARFTNQSSDNDHSPPFGLGARLEDCLWRLQTRMVDYARFSVDLGSST